MTWNYRVVRSVTDGEESFELYEIYYNEAGYVTNWSDVQVGASDMDDLKATIELMQAALDDPIIEYSDLPHGAGLGS